MLRDMGFILYFCFSNCWVPPCQGLVQVLSLWPGTVHTHTNSCPCQCCSGKGKNNTMSKVRIRRVLWLGVWGICVWREHVNEKSNRPYYKLWRNSRLEDYSAHSVSEWWPQCKMRSWVVFQDTIFSINICHLISSIWCTLNRSQYLYSNHLEKKGQPQAQQGMK